jgi:hypothetical protein
MIRSRTLLHAAIPALAALLAAGCGTGEEARSGEPAAERAADGATAAERVLAREVARIDSAAAAVDAIFQPLPLLRPAQEEALRRFLNRDQLARARALGVGR